MSGVVFARSLPPIAARPIVAAYATETNESVGSQKLRVGFFRGIDFVRIETGQRRLGDVFDDADLVKGDEAH